MLEDAANGARNIVGGAENAIEGAAGGVSNTMKNVTAGAENTMQKAGNSVSNTATSMTNNVGNGDYAASRTSTNAEGNATFMGMTATMWTWLIMGIAAIAIVALVWYYSNQIRTSRYDDTDRF